MEQNRFTSIMVVTVLVLLLIVSEKVYADYEKPSYMIHSFIWERDEDTQYRSSSIKEDYEIDWDYEMVIVSDPIYFLNKSIFDLNDKIYSYVLTPFLEWYNFFVPLTVRIGAKNFFENITMPTRFVNCLLQGKLDAAQGEMAKFIINTTFGIGGILNLASKYPELNPPIEDMGQTLGSYKIGNGFYIVWPILGPSTLRDSIGMIGDWFLNPVHCIIEEVRDRVPIFSIETINKFSFKSGQYEAIREASFDPYEAFRDAYIQNRNSKIAR